MKCILKAATITILHTRDEIREGRKKRQSAVSCLNLRDLGSAKNLLLLLLLQSSLTECVKRNLCEKKKMRTNYNSIISCADEEELQEMDGGEENVKCLPD